MRAEYDSQAGALSIDLRTVDRWDDGEGVDDDYCTVAFADGRPASIELLSPRDHLDLLGTAAERYGLDREAVLAAARSALEAPDPDRRRGRPRPRARQALTVSSPSSSNSPTSSE